MHRDAVAQNHTQLHTPGEIIHIIKRHITGAERRCQRSINQSGISLPEFDQSRRFKLSYPTDKFFHILFHRPAMRMIGIGSYGIDKVDFQSVKSHLTEYIANTCQRFSGGSGIFRVKNSLPLVQFSKIFAYTLIQFTAAAGKKRCDPEHIVQSEFLSFAHGIFHFRQFFFRPLPVTDIPVPIRQSLRRHPLVFTETPAVIHNECAESQTAGFNGIFLQILIGDRRMDSIP